LRERQQVHTLESIIKKAVPEAMLPWMVGINFKSDIVVTLLPHPLSPTRANNSPFLIRKLTPSTGLCDAGFRIEISRKVFYG
jgi:hypothetical protein